MVPTNHSLPTETINKLLGYLSTKAFSEVAELIAEVRSKAKACAEAFEAVPQDEQGK